MNRVKFMTAKQAVKMIPDSAVIGTVGFLMTGTPEELLLSLGQRFLEERKPTGLTIMWASGPGDGGTVRGLNHLCHEGLLKRTIGGHYGLFPKIAPLINENKMEAYNFPQGVLTSMFREMAARRPGVLTHVGLETFVDPEYQGGKLNRAATEDLVQKIDINGKKYLFYQAQKLDVALLRGTEADEDGNIGISREALRLENLSVATAARNAGGLVIVQVERLVKRGTLDPKQVVVPGAMVDAVALVSDPKNHMQTAGTDFNVEFISQAGVYKSNFKPAEHDIRKVVGRRAVLEMNSTMRILNFGIGIPEKVAAQLKEENVESAFISTVEPGIYGGASQGGLDFGSAVGPHAIIDHPYQFDFYDGGGIDISFLGMAECNPDGSLNVSKFGPKIPGCGGYIDISQNAKQCVFCGTFTAGGLKVKADGGRLEILQEGREKKFLKSIEQITFNGKYESLKGKKITLVTERAVFEVRPEGLTLTEIAPGVDLENDVLKQMEFKPVISPDLKTMEEAIFTPAPLGLRKRFGLSE